MFWALGGNVFESCGFTPQAFGVIRLSVEFTKVQRFGIFMLRAYGLGTRAFRLQVSSSTF